MKAQTALERSARRAHGQSSSRVAGKNFYRPSLHQWEVLYALEAGPLPCSSITTAGAHVGRLSAQKLQRQGLVAQRPDTTMELTEAGRQRLARGW